jgi:hypothetical protein
MPGERRSFGRVQFGRGYTARIVAIDGTWQRDCRIGDVSDTGAKLTVRGSLAGLKVDEFFLMLTLTGTAHRRCERVWLNADEIGVRFLKERAGQDHDWTTAAAVMHRTEPASSE